MTSSSDGMRNARNVASADGTGPDGTTIDVSVVIPVFRAAATLGTLLDELVHVLERIGQPYEVICVDDGSPDGSWRVLRELIERYAGKLVAVRLMRNFGQHNALMCGFRQARGQVIVTLDDDLQHPPEEIPKLLAELRDRELDLVYGVYDQKRHGAWRNLGSRVVNAFFRLVFRSKIHVTSFRAIRREVVEAVLSYSLNFTYIDGLLAWNTDRVGEVAVEHQPRREGRSGYSVRKLLVLALNLFTNFSLLPLQVVTAMGTVAAISGLALGAFYIVQYLRSAITVPGYASTIVVVLVMGGLQLLSLGVIGEYLGRLHLNVNRKPQYTVREVSRAVSPEGTPGAGNCVRKALNIDENLP